MSTFIMFDSMKTILAIKLLLIGIIVFLMLHYLKFTFITNRFIQAINPKFFFNIKSQFDCMFQAYSSKADWLDKAMLFLLLCIIEYVSKGSKCSFVFFKKNIWIHRHYYLEFLLIESIIIIAQNIFIDKFLNQSKIWIWISIKIKNVFDLFFIFIYKTKSPVFINQIRKFKNNKSKQLKQYN